MDPTGGNQPGSETVRVARTSRCGWAALALCIASCAGPTERLREGPQHVLLDDREVHYSVTGHRGSVILLVHGWACDQRVWWKNVSDLSRDHRVIAIDLPGHGQSAEPARSYSMDLFADAIAAVLDAEHVSSAILLAHSNGVPVARQFYRRHRSRVAKLVLIDGPLQSMIPTEEAAGIRKLFERDDFVATVRQFVMSMPAPNLLEADRARIAEVASAQPQHAVLGGLVAATDPTIWRDDSIEIPVLMINARQPAWSAAYEEYVRELVPDLDYRLVNDVGHFIMVEQPERLLEWVTEFLQ